MSKINSIATLCLILLSYKSYSQVCTVSNAAASINWTNATAITCVEGGNLSAYSVLRIPAGKTIVFNDNSDTWTGSNIEVFGILRITAQVVINSNITIKSGGLVDVSSAGSRLQMGTAGGCNFSLAIESGGILDVGNASTRLFICGEEIVRGGSGGGCNPCPQVPPASGNYDCTGVDLPYCETPGGFQGPINLGENGVLPIELIFFNAAQSGSAIKLNWATSMEEDFSHFVVQHAVNGFDYDDLDEVAGAGYNTESQNDYEYTHTLPLIGYNYYRLKAIDLNGSFEYFGPVVEQFTGSRALWIHPNPVTTDKVEYQLNFTPNEGDRIQVFNGVGQVVADMPADQNTGVVYFTSTVQSGSYILKYTTATSTYYARFIVLK